MMGGSPFTGFPAILRNDADKEYTIEKNDPDIIYRHIIAIIGQLQEKRCSQFAGACCYQPGHNCNDNHRRSACYQNQCAKGLCALHGLV